MESIKNNPDKKEQFTKLFIELNRISNQFNNTVNKKQSFKQKLNRTIKVG